MEIVQTWFDAVKLLQPRVFSDNRGYFYEAWQKPRYENAGFSEAFVQDNVSKSVKGTLRGLHYQAPPSPQGKLCQVLAGRVLDVAVDIRDGSPTFGQYASTELSDENNRQLWIPQGFAHGFLVLSDSAIFHYKCTGYYDKSAERTIIYNDSDINIDWGIEQPVLSEKDLLGVPLSTIEKEFIY